MKTVLTIAGFDPSSGAGVTADLKVFAAHGLFGTACITALTVQSTVGVAGCYPVEAKVVRETLEHLHSDLPPDGIKIGMLATAEIVAVVADYLASHTDVPVVLDPVLRSSSGRELLSGEGLHAMRERLLPLVDAVTPNLDELALLTGIGVRTREEMAVAARALARLHPRLAVFATGGHLDRPDDLLITAQRTEHWMGGERVETTSTHGTGCALASAMLCGLVAGRDAAAAAAAAKMYVAGALRNAVPLGAGHGPLNHLWPLREGVGRCGKAERG